MDGSGSEWKRWFVAPWTLRKNVLIRWRNSHLWSEKYHLLDHVTTDEGRGFGEGWWGWWRMEKLMRKEESYGGKELMTEKWGGWWGEGRDRWDAGKERNGEWGTCTLWWDRWGTGKKASAVPCICFLCHPLYFFVFTVLGCLDVFFL